MTLPCLSRWLRILICLGIVPFAPAAAEITVTSTDQYVDASSYSDDEEGPFADFELDDVGALDKTAASSVDTEAGAASISSHLVSSVTLQGASLVVNAAQSGNYSLRGGSGVSSLTSVSVTFTASTPFLCRSSASATASGDEFGSPLVSLVNDDTGSVFEYEAGTPPTSGATSGKLPAGDYTLTAEADIFGDAFGEEVQTGTFGFQLGLKIVSLDPPVLTVQAPVSTDQAKVRIAGTAKSTSAIKRVEYKVAGKAKYRPAKGRGTWYFNLRLKPGPNKLTIRALDVAGGSVSKKLRIVRTPAP